MPAYKLTGYHSHRHPFLGSDEHAMVQLADAGNEGNIIDLDNPLAPGIYEALAAEEEAAQQQPLSVAKVARPFIAGITSGLIVYGIARAYKVDSKKAAQVSFVFGGVSVLFGLASDFIYREMKALAAAQTTETITTPEGT